MIDRVATILALGIAVAAIVLYLFDAPAPIPQAMSVGDGPYKALIVGADRMGVVKGFDNPQQCEKWYATFRNDADRQWIDGIICLNKLETVTTGNMVLPPLEDK